VTRHIRTNKDFDDIPILLLTAFHDVSVVEGLDAGANDFIRKPFDHDELLARVRSLLRLKHSLDAQREMARAREDFVSRLTHDLRTPLVAADRMLTLFKQEVFCPISDDMKQAITAMSRSNNNLLEMVNTLLEVSRFEANKKSMNFASCNLIEIIDEVVQELQLLAEEKDLTITVENKLNADAENASCVLGDRLELRRVIGNLLGNAIKFTDAGGVTIRIQKTPALQTNKNCISVEIEDTGYGIASEDLPELFKRFRQGKNKRAGSGLGLHLSQRIIETHGGTIEASSELGKGSIFTISIPQE
jgi:signal transduction histidine kinase